MGSGRPLRASAPLGEKPAVLFDACESLHMAAPLKEIKRWDLHSRFASMAVVDGMIWEQTDEPALIVQSEPDGGAIMYLGQPNRWLAAHEHFVFCLRDHAVARQFMEDNFDKSKLLYLVDDFEILIPEALSPSMEYDEVIRGIRAFFDEAAGDLEYYTRESGRLWFRMKALLGTDDNVPDADVVDEIVDVMQTLATRLSDEKTRTYGIKARLDRLSKLTAERWMLRPLDATPGMRKG